MIRGGRVTAMSQVLPLRPPRPRPEETTAWIGMLVFIAAWAMMFGALFVVYGWLRVRAGAWPPPGAPRVPLALLVGNTVVIALSSIVLQRGLGAVRSGRGLLAPSVLGAAALGAAFLALQLVMWRGMWAAGLRPSTGTYASVIFGMTALHAAHVAVGIVALAVLGVRAARGAFTPASHLPVRLWTAYWHGVGAIWLAVFALVFVI